MILFNHYFMTGFIQLLVILLYDTIFSGGLFTETGGLLNALIIWLLWPIFDSVVLGLCIRDYLKK